MTGLEASRIRVLAGDKVLIDGVDCSVAPGSLTALIGPNGAGKSTLLRALAAVQEPQAGSVVFDERDLFAMPRKERARIAALVEQDVTTELAMSVASVVALGRLPHQSLWQGDSEHSRRVVASMLDAVGMSTFAERDFTTLSGGERQRVMLAKAMAQEPRLLLLDEPTNHLDVSAQLSTLGLLGDLARQGATILAALHDLNLAASYCDAVVVMNGGRVIAAGPVMDTITPQLIGLVYGVDATMLAHPVSGRHVIAFSPRGAKR